MLNSFIVILCPDLSTPMPTSAVYFYYISIKYMLRCCTMIIKKPVKPTKEQLNEMTKLVNLCGNHDGIKAELDVDESFKNPEDVNIFLLYRDAKLLSFINLFAPKKTEAELSAFTLPEYRKHGFFNKLLKEARAEVLSRGTGDFLYVCDRESKDGQAVVKHLNAVYDFSEYCMAYTHTRAEGGKQPDISIRESVPEDSDQLVKLSLLSFDESEEDAKNYIKNIFSSENRIQHVAMSGDMITGMISMAIEGRKSYIHGLSVLPEHRKCGIGGALLDYKVAESIKLHPDYQIELEVMTGNSRALSIYRRAGFKTRACYDYFRKPVT